MLHLADHGHDRDARQGSTEMKVNRWLGVVVILCVALSAGAWAGIEQGSRHFGHPDWMHADFVDLQLDLERAAEQGKTGVMVLFTTQGCTYCAAFIQRSLGDPALQRKLRDNFMTLGLEIFDDVVMTDPGGEELPIKAFAVREGAGMAPTLLFYGLDGTRQLRAVGYQSPERFDAMLDYLIEGRQHELAFRDYLAQRAASQSAVDDYPALRPDPMFMRPPYALARQPVAADRPLLVIFERTGCGDCRRFHEQVLALPEVRERLGGFEVVRLDAADRETPVLAPDGERTTPADWFAAEGFSRVPALLFVDEQGEAVLRNDALTERQRMLNMTGLVLEKKYLDGWTYQRYARNQAMERNRREAAGTP
jgi:thioredoxin-related protein